MRSGGTRMRLPGTLYMYCPPTAVALLLDRRFKITSPHQLNDPFEFAPAFVGRASKAWLLKHFSQEHVIREEYSISKLDMSYEDYAKWSEQNRETSVESLYKRQEHVRSEAKKRLSEISDKSKVLCLSARCDGLLSWALYADKHRGFVIGLDSGILTPSSLVKISYSRKRPSINLKTALIANSTKMMELWRRAVRTKSPEWKHEREYRCIFRKEHAKRELGENGNETFYVGYNPSLIREVIFGANCQPETVSTIDEALEDPEFHNVTRLTACLDERRFRVRIVPRKL
jgi:hypothetical protein